MLPQSQVLFQVVGLDLVEDSRLSVCVLIQLTEKYDKARCVGLDQGGWVDDRRRMEASSDNAGGESPSQEGAQHHDVGDLLGSVVR